MRNQSTHQVFHNLVLPSLIPFQLIPTINGNQIELIINWQFPKHQVKIFRKYFFLSIYFVKDLDFGLSVLSTPNGSQRTNIGIMTRSNTDFMPNWDVPGWDYFNVSGITNAFDCQHAFDEDDKCRAWTFVSTRQVHNNCFRKHGMPLDWEGKGYNFSLLLNLSCIKKVSSSTFRETLVTENHIDEEFEKETKKLDRMFVPFVRRNYFLTRFQSISSNSN